MSERVIKTGLSKKYKDMLDAVIGQMSDGYWENTPMMVGYWKFVTTGTSGDEVTLNVDTASGAREGDRRIGNRFYDMSDDAVKKFFADKIKFLIKEEGLGKWDRSNDSETDYLSYGSPRYRVKDCYYAYEVLKGRNAGKHPEYDDVPEANGSKKYTFTWWDNEPTADRRATTSADLKNCLHKETFNAADDDAALKTAVGYLCDYIGDDPEDVASTPKKIWDYFDGDWSSGDPIPMVLKQGSRVVKDSGFNPKKGGDDDDWESKQPVKIKLVERAKNAVEELFAKWIDAGASGMRLTPDGKGILCHDQYGTLVRYAAGVLTFSFEKDDVEDDLLDLELVISKHTAFRVFVNDAKVKITASIQPDEAVKLLTEFFDA